MGEPHLDLFMLTSRLLEAHCASDRSGNVSCMQLSLLARYRSVLPSCTVPLVPSCFPAGQ
jgi:hypothetical protein